MEEGSCVTRRSRIAASRRRLARLPGRIPVLAISGGALNLITPEPLRRALAWPQPW